MSAYMLITYVPTESCSALKQALFAAGAGRIGAYDSCCWQVEGQGQFRPLAGARPSIGEQGKTETVAETRLEMMVAGELRGAVDEALRSSHPYETPAYFWLAVANDAAPESSIAETA